MPKGSEKPSPIVARPPEPERGQMAKLCEQYDKSHTDMLLDFWHIYGGRLAQVWDDELEAARKIREGA